MSRIGYGYGSEWHLLRYLGYHRAELSRQVAALTGAESVEWLDAPFSELRDPLYQDREYVGVEFLGVFHALQQAWSAFWPQRGSAQSWDAVARLHSPAGPEWLLVEAKARVGELLAPCQAKAVASIAQIDRAFDATRRVAGAEAIPSATWRGNYYQYANRLAALHFLTNICEPAIPAQLLFIYFCGDPHPKIVGPAAAAVWAPWIDAMYRELGIDPSAPLMQRVRHLFLPVNPVGQRHVMPESM